MLLSQEGSEETVNVNVDLNSETASSKNKDSNNKFKDDRDIANSQLLWLNIMRKETVGPCLSLTRTSKSFEDGSISMHYQLLAARR